VRVLIVEDEIKLASVIRRGLRAEGLAADVAARGEDAIWMAGATDYDAVVLDVMLPGMDGFEVCAKLREDSVWAPVIMLTARDGVEDRIAGLDHGADDYLTKPFNTGELLARIRVVLRHAARRPSGGELPVFEQGHLKVDLAARRVFVKGIETHLTPIEYKLLTTLVQNAGKVLTHRFLLKEVWGPQQVQDTHYLRVFMAGLRRKIEDDPAQPRYLLTDQGVGYRFASA
jgi:two-component system KDP operon response regulator KdpE